MKDQKGFTLIEVVVSIALLSIIVAGFLGALGTSSKTLLTTDVNETAKNIAEMQLEYVKGQGYAASYSPRDISSTYPGFTVDDPIQGDPINSRDSNIQKLTVTVRHQGKIVYTLVGYKENKKI